VSYFKDDINTMMDTLSGGSGYHLTEVDLSGFMKFE